jgi:hypothetical protein
MIFANIYDIFCEVVVYVIGEGAYLIRRMGERSGVVISSSLG